jgi:hypothetical protein
MPIVERSFEWVTSAEGMSFVHIRLLITNRLDETLIVETIQIRTPSRQRLRQLSRVRVDRGGQSQWEDRPSADGHRKVRIWREIMPSGDVRIAAFATQSVRVDRERFRFYLGPVKSARGLNIKLVVCVSSKALTIRHKRIVIKSRMTPRPAKQTDEKASSSD